MQFKTSPFPHQLEEFEYSKDLESRALFWEMGTGKSWAIINTAAHLFLEGKINHFLVLAPSGVHQNWVTDELPKHLPDEVKHRTFLWQSSKATQVGFKQRLARFKRWDEGLRILVMSYDSLMTEAGKKASQWFVKPKEHRCLVVLDESTHVKNANAKRTKRVMSIRRYADYRRILTGTPITNSPFDIYPQLKFVDASSLLALGVSTSDAFRATFGQWQHIQLKNDRSFRKCVGYRNLDDLKAIVDEVGSRLLKDDVLDLPPKLYNKIYFDLEPEQRRIYKELRDDWMATLTNGDPITVDLTITRLIRFQQVTSGYLPTDDEREVLQPITDKNPRIRAMRRLVADIPHKAIIFAKYDCDVDTIMAALHKDGLSAAAYDGRTSGDQRAEIKRRFQHEDDIQFFVGKPTVAGEGLTLTAAKTVIYYNTDYRLDKRLQSEDRAHRIGQDRPVNYFDIVAADTIDPQIISALRSKREIAATITGDELGEWI